MKRTSLVINNNIRRGAPRVLSSKGIQVAMQFYCNVLMLGFSGGIDFYPAGEVYGVENKFFTIGIGECENMLHAFNSCNRIAADISLDKFQDNLPSAVIITMQFFPTESLESLYAFSVGFSVNEGRYCFSSVLINSLVR